VTIKDSVSKPDGKYPKELGNVMVMRIVDFQTLLFDSITAAFD
jgi:hypothetical protein